MKSFNVLMTAGSRRVPLVQAFRTALRTLGLPGSVVVTDVNPLSPAVHVADRSYRVPMATEPDYLSEVLALCEAESIRLVVPTIDDELPIFGAARERFSARGTLVACSSEETALVCNDKFETCSRLRAAGVAAAETHLTSAMPKDLAPPLFIKPRIGRGGVAAFAIKTQRDLEFFPGYVPNAVVQEYLDGPEFTIDVLCDLQGVPVSIVPRERVVIRAGVMDRGRTVNDSRLIALAMQACAAIPFVGAINIQVRMRGNEPAIFEINPRFSGGIPLTIQAGADFPSMLIKMALGRQVAPMVGEFKKDLWMTSFESSFFLDGADLHAQAFELRSHVEEAA
ncbi:MAG: ATP-grasp domain-containing protein [Vicinamibacterales bacterium]